MNQAASETPQNHVQQISLKELGLRPGIALQVRRLVEGASKKEGQLFGAIENRGVMVGPQGPEGEDTGLTEGDVCIVRGFTGQHEFSFISKVLQTYEKPFVYALLAYPTQVDARRVRQSLRTKTGWPVTAQVGELSQAGQLLDISLQGAMISTPVQIAAVGKVIALGIHCMVEGESSTLALKASVCHSHRAVSGEIHFTGMAFHGLSQQDKLVLHYLTTTPQG
ncbi:MAG: PilZ domain-containing protein [Burkholderiales bacterium]|nr:PilZ domain-containing protein [Burkholderiales bacterium]